MEHEYLKYRKDSQAMFRDETQQGKKLDRFEPSEKRKKEKREPEQALSIKNTYGQFQLGEVKRKNRREPENQLLHNENIALVSGLRKDRKKELKDHELFKETGSASIQILQKRVRLNPHHKEKSAAMLRMEPEKTGNRLALSLSEMAESGKLKTVQQLLPFLNEKREKEEKERLLEERNLCGGLSKEKERYLEEVKENELHKQRERYRFVQKADLILRQNKESLVDTAEKAGETLEEYRKKIWGNPSPEENTEENTEEDEENNRE